MNLRGIVVCVDYDDLLAVTLPRNIQHFDEVLVVTSPQDAVTQALVQTIPKARVFVTDAFYRRGAVFNKGLAIEEAFAELGRTGWLLLWDADIVMPAQMDLSMCQPGFLYSPRRRMLRDAALFSDTLDWTPLPVANERDFAGYFQLFHADDPALAAHPWYDVSWRHAGGCDSVFQQRWPDQHKIRPPFHVLHLGPDGQNWHGRATPRLDNGQTPPEAKQRLTAIQRMHQLRTKHGYRHERLDP